MEFLVYPREGADRFTDIEAFRRIEGASFNSLATVTSGEVSGLDWSDVVLDDALDLGAANEGVAVLRHCTFRNVRARAFRFRALILEDCRFEDVRIKDWRASRTIIRNSVFSGCADGTIWVGGSELAQTTIIEDNDFQDFYFTHGLDARNGIQLGSNRFRLEGNGVLILDRRPVILQAIDIIKKEWEDPKLRKELIRDLGFAAEEGDGGQAEWYISKPPLCSFPWQDYLRVLKRAAPRRVWNSGRSTARPHGSPADGVD